MIIILMGVAGAGKSTVGRRLAQELGWQFYDGDDFHPQATVDKMAQGIPLTDADRLPWLDALHALIGRLIDKGEPAVVTCSALKEAYRRRLRQGYEGVYLVYLKGEYGLIHQRLVARAGHFMRANLLASQFAALEEPENGLIVEVSAEPEAIVQFIMEAIKET